MSEIWDVLASPSRLDLWFSLGLAALLGGVVGFERETRGKSAGLRTNILICLGSTLFTHASIVMAADGGDPTRIAAQIVTGVGFLGAGTILQRGAGIVGLTTAATIWVVAAIGVAVGIGARVEAIGTTILVLIVLSVVQRLEPRDPPNDGPTPGADKGS